MDPDRRRRPTRTPLYDERYEHDACGVGFVADAGGRSRDRVLPLAIQGLSALGHRGAFAADGESSDGAGVSFPLDRSVLAAVAGDAVAATRPGIAMLFLPRGRSPERAARALVERILVEADLPLLAWRSVPFEPSALGAAAAASRPTPMQAIIGRPTRSAGDDRPLTDDAFERRLVVARRRLEQAVRSVGGPLAELSAPSMSCRTVVYKGLVAGGHLADLYPDLRLPLEVGYAVFHQRYATNTRPVWRLAQPFRHIAHNGEINTVRGNREQVRGRTRDDGAKPIARELIEAGPLLSPDGSDSLSLDEGLELLTTTGWDLAPAILAAIPEALPLRRAPHPHVATLRRRTAGMLAPWDGPAAIVFADGQRVGGLIDRNGLRPAAFAVSSDRLVALVSEAGAVPFAASETIRRGRLGPGELLLVDPGRKAILEDTDAKAWALRSLQIHDAPRPIHEDATDAIEDHGATGARGPLPRRPRRRTREAGHQDDGARSARAAVEHGRRHADRRAGAASIGRSRTICARRSRRSPTRRSTPSASASSWTCGWSSGVGRPCSVARRGARGRCAWHARSWPTSPDSGRPCATGGHRTRTLDATWPAAAGPDGLATALAGLATAAVEAAERGVEVLIVSDAAGSLDQLPIPSILAAGAVHTALTDAGLRGRTDLVIDASDILDVHGMAMVLAVGATAAHPRLAIELAAELAGTRGAEALDAAATVGNLVGAFEAGLRKTLARMGISAVASYIGGALIDTIDLAPDVLARCFPMAAAWPGRTTLTDLAARQLRRRDAALALPPAPAGREPKLPDPGWARFRADGEAHLFSPSIAKEIQVLSGSLPAEARAGEPPGAASPSTPRWRATAPPSIGRSQSRACHATSSGSAAWPLRCRSRRSRMRAPSRGGSSSRR